MTPLRRTRATQPSPYLRAAETSALLHASLDSRLRRLDQADLMTTDEAAALLFAWPTLNWLALLWVVGWPVMVLTLLIGALGFSTTVMMMFFVGAAAGLILRKRPLIIRRGK